MVSKESSCRIVEILGSTVSIVEEGRSTSVLINRTTLGPELITVQDVMDDAKNDIAEGFLTGAVPHSLHSKHAD